MRKQHGFTLLEVLVALVLIGLLMVVLFGGFRAGIRSWQIAESHTSSVEEMRQLSSLLYRHLGQLQTAEPMLSESGQALPVYLWEASQVRYVAPLAISTGGTPYLFELISDAPGMEGVWVRFAPFRPGTAADQLFAEAQFQQVSSSVHFDFRYYTKSDDPAQPGAWSEAVNAEASTPQLVSVRFRAEGKEWPELTFPILMSGAIDE